MWTDSIRKIPASEGVHISKLETVGQCARKSEMAFEIKTSLMSCVRNFIDHMK